MSGFPYSRPAPAYWSVLKTERQTGPEMTLRER